MVVRAHTRRTLRGVIATAGAAAMLLALVGTASEANAATAPSDPSVIFSENFENTSTPVVGIRAYTGVKGETYQADDFWADPTQCNGLVISSKTTDADLSAAGATGCAYPAGDKVRQLAQALGSYHNDPNNHAVTAYTNGYDGPADQTRVLQTPGIQLTAGHYYVAGVDAAEANCIAGATQANLVFDLGTSQLGNTVLNPCTDPDSSTVDNTSDPIRVASLVSDPFLVQNTGAQPLILRNNTTSGQGNDFAYDNIQLLDATPTIEKAFTDSKGNTLTSTPVGVPFNVTFTITNTSEKSAKQGWSFTDNLPTNMTVASSGTSSTTCGTGTAVSATAGASKIDVTAGNLTRGTASCTVTAPVVVSQGSTEGTTYTNSVSGTGVLGNPSASITAYAPHLSIVKTSDTKEITTAGQQVNYSFAVTNDGKVPVTDVAVAEGTFSGKGKLSAVTCPADQVKTLAPAASVTCTAEYTVVAADLASKTLTNTAEATGVGPDGSAVDSDPSTVQIPTVVPATATPSASATPSTIAAAPAALAQTGETAGAIIAGALAALAGAVALVLARRRRQH